ncbi:conserved hypothetical protein [Rhizobium johnstonii 3841]|uniref:Uncharacterized protein n=1 Tax=Rhizobium johnstonii (strain DSM 114642 / LMG 32736 / 3841) TaxID=216596 RepID=Q1MKV6_RHIJ3|nr:conserved hypothetical protein [Rhizobium johnstonii 3841]
MHVDDEVAHMRIVDRLLRLRLPGRQRRGIIRENADNIETLQVTELDVIEAFQFAAKNEMQKLLLVTGVSHFLFSFCLFSSATHLRDFDGNVNCLVVPQRR